MSLLKIKDLLFSYNKDEEVLKISNLEIVDGEKVFIYGPSGSGKSTFLNLLSGVLTPTSGEIEFEGKAFSGLSSKKRDKIRSDKMGYIFQRFNLIHYLSVKENIFLPLKLNDKFSLHQNVYNQRLQELSRVLKIESLLHKNVDELSQGQQQRVAVARAILGRPKLVIADEPTSSLDEEVTEDFMQLLMSEWESEKFTLIFVSHDRRLEKFFDRSISLKEINGI